MKASFRREDYRRQKRKIRLFRLGAFFLLCAVIFACLVYLSRLDKFRITEVEFKGGVLISSEDIVTETNKFLSGNYFWLFPKNNIVLYPGDDLENFLKEKFKRIDTISIFADGQTLSISVKERGLYALWCHSEYDMSEKCYFMDNNGVIFSEAPNFSGDAYFKYYGYLSSSTDPIGSYYLSSISLFKDISGFVEKTKESDIVHPISLEAKDNDQFELKLSPEGMIYLDTSDSMSKASDNLNALLKTIYSASSSKDAVVDYIDLRYGNKLFYKLK